MLDLENNNQINNDACPNCYLCGSSGELLYQKLQDCLFGAPGEWNLKKCPNSECGLVWLDPMPVEEDIAKAYQTYYTHEIDNSQKSFIRLILSNIYNTASIVPWYLLDLKAQEVQLNTMYLANTRTGKLLDVGCGSGKFLNNMRLTGWEVEGVDFDPKAVELARTKYSINAHLGSLESIRFADNSFDAITMSHVVEHVFNPVALLQECYRILKPGGKLIALTPNINSWGHQKFKNNWRGLEPPRHFHLFSQITLRKCASKAGFNKNYTCTLSVRSLYWFSASYDIQKFKKWKSKKKENEINLLKSLQSLSDYYLACILSKMNHDLGEELILIAEKK